jgi:NAD(P)H-hydrate repair Nnr-like enzyme with NAD(P)H-hydrate epimerase domain
MQVTSLSLEAFKEMDYWAVEKYNLSIQLMMENAGLQLARLIAKKQLRPLLLLSALVMGTMAVAD